MGGVLLGTLPVTSLSRQCLDSDPGTGVGWLGGVQQIAGGTLEVDMNDERAAPTVETVIVSPDLAETWMRKNRSNRKLRGVVVDRYGRDMREGRWRLKGQQPILFDREGWMQNGQHRLWACIQTGVSFPALVIRNCDPEDIAAVDTGSPRRFSDYLSWQGIENGVGLASAIRMSWMWDAGALQGLTVGGWPKILLLTHQEGGVWLTTHPTIRDSLEAVKALGGKPLRLPLAVAATLHHRVHTDLPKQTDEFFRQLGSDTNLPEGSPSVATRRWLLNVATQRVKGRPKWWVYLAICIKGFNAHVRRQTVSKIGWGGKETFPKPVTAAEVDVTSERPSLAG